MKIDAGRVIAYGGGSGVSATSLAAKATPAGVPPITPEPNGLVSLLNLPLVTFGNVQLLAADVVSIAGLVFVALRLAFDIFKWWDERRDQRDKGANDGPE